MLSSNSPLKRIPAKLDKRQALFLDGIRHAAELATLSYSRLTDTLLKLAFREESIPEQSITSAFLDAWATVDSIDRFRALWKLQPNSETIQTGFSPATVEERFRDVRSVRNVADHLAQRVDYILSKSGTALGVLSWVAVKDRESTTGRSCLLVPGSIDTTTQKLPMPSGNVVLPVGFVQLKAGEHTANITDAFYFMASVISFAERSLDVPFSKAGGDVLGSDMIMQGDFSFS